MNQEAKTTKVFFYGTLKRGEPNYEHTVAHRCEFLCEAITIEKWPLIINTEYNVPFLLNQKGTGKNVHGEVYWVDSKAREFFDEFERGYSPLSVQVRDKSSGEVHDCMTYMLDKFRPSLVSDAKILFDNYSSKNDFYPEYMKKADNPKDIIGLEKRDKAYDELKN